jgi:excisionase family DNA binding protein
MTDPLEVTVLNPDYWVEHGLQLAQLIAAGATSPIGDPTGTPPDPETMLTISDPDYWSAQPHELQEVLTIASGAATTQHTGGGLASGAASTSEERLTLTVEEAATALGISRAFAYESVRRGDIPHLKIGRRLLVPRAALERMLSSAMPSDIDEISPDTS